MRHSRIIALLLPLLAGAMAQATDAGPPAAACASCHGARGEGNPLLDAPPLAGQDAGYLERQLRNFKSGKRAYAADDKAGATMRAVAAGLKEADFAVLARVYSQMPAAASPVAKSPDVAAGKALYAVTCAACHGEHAQGYPQLQAPSLRILGGRYIGQQLNAFAKGWRGNADKADQPAVWMRAIASHVSDPKEVAGLLKYFDSLSAAKQPGMGSSGGR